MNKLSQQIEEYKIQASILLKSHRSNNSEKMKLASKRLQRLPEFSAISLEKIEHAIIQRKHALAVIAMEKGFTSWINLKAQLQLFDGGFLNAWFSNYTEAKQQHLASGGYLLPYKQHYYICDDDYIRHIGLDPNDPNWRLINNDFAKPGDHNAWLRLNAQLNSFHGEKS